MLLNALLKAQENTPSALAVDDGQHAFTYDRLTRVARTLRDLIDRADPGPNVGLLLPASAVFPAALFGVLWTGRVAVPLNFLLAADELAAVVNDAGVTTVLTVRPFQSLVAALPVRPLFLEDLPIQRGVLLGHLRRRPPIPDVTDHDTAVILYTSGTTAGPKGVELTYSNLHSNCVDSIAALHMEKDHRFLSVLPPFHVFGLTACVLIPVYLGTSVFALPRFNPLAAIRAVASKQISIMIAIPSMYAAMLRTKSATKEAFASCRLAISGGEPLPENVRLGFEERFGVVLRQGYGLTETSPVVAACGRTVHRVGTVGKPIPHVEIRIVESDGRPAADGQDGEILVRGPGVMKGYYRKPEETRRVLDADGWFHTGDLGRLDADGFLRITGRAKDMLIVGGENVFAREIEAVLENHEAVAQAAVIGMPDDLRGEVPWAFVIPRPGAEVAESELRAFAKQSLAGFKVPRRIEIREELPTGPTGKILKRRLRQSVSVDDTQGTSEPPP
jgi:long-chain acyl-CoA synthetase